MLPSKLKYKYPDLKDSRGVRRTQSLFWEFRYDEDGDKYPAYFTIKDYDLVKDGVTYYSLKQIYLSYDHIPGYEYEFALDLFDSWDHWDTISNKTIPKIKNEIGRWREELEVKLKSQAIRAIITSSKDTDAKGFNAAKYLAEKGYAPTRGRPSKDEVERTRRIEAGVNRDLEDDMARLGITVVAGGK